MAGMNIAERYVPQDGHITLRFEGAEGRHSRESTVPTLYGESVVMRILDKEHDLAGTSRVARECRAARPVETVDKLDRQLPHGTRAGDGPDGLAARRPRCTRRFTKLYTPDEEDHHDRGPGGVRAARASTRSTVNPKRGPDASRRVCGHILRQDPDVIMVGEIRDRETADIAVRSAMTGHLVFSHAAHERRGVRDYGRLIDMGVEPFLLASVLEGVMAQRLGRRIDPACRTIGPIPEEVRLRLSPEERALFPDGTAPIATPGEDNATGYRGRLGFYEVIDVMPALRAGIGENLSSAQLVERCPPSHVTMRRDGLIKAAEGMTTIEEVLRATQDVDDDE
jgi:type II secretory ATPase GspE/PulE/Tfp pilus assembly ATPase PilB-like protein